MRYPRTLSPISKLLLAAFLLGLATCSGGQSPPCGGRFCNADEVCLVTAIDFGPPTYSCVDNPCGSDPLDCSCAAALCEGFSCSTSAEERRVSCFCPAC
jgi:hypothetical protein